MTRDRKYKSPPVVEALCELFFAGSVWDDTVPGRFYERVKDRFPVRRQREIREAQIAVSNAGEASAGIRRLAPWMQFFSEKGNCLVQLRQNELTVNHLRPYPRFEDWEPEILFAVETYRELAQPKGVVRLGMRYINRVVIPRRPVRMEDYFTIYPSLPSGMGQTHGPFMISIELPMKSPGHCVLLTFGSAPAENENHMAFILDIYDITSPTTELRPFEGVAREIKIAHDNVVIAFENSMTEELRKIFQEEER